MSGWLRWANWLMCALFALAVVVQYNDPDPARWMLLYGTAVAVTLAAGLHRRIHGAALLLVGAIALAWGLSIIIGGPAAGEYPHMFDAWEMRSPPVEEAREASGLLIVAGWMAVLTVSQRRGGKR